MSNSPSVGGASKQCEKTDHVTHKKECKKLLKQRKAASRKDIDMAHSGGGGDIIPRIGVALSESITGVHGEDICHLPCWIIEKFATMTRGSLDDARKVARSIRHFFKVFQSSASAEAAKRLSVKDTGACAKMPYFYTG